MKRTETRSVPVGKLTLGHQQRVAIQSMCTIKTEKVEEVVQQINTLATYGADIMRVSIMDEKDAYAIKEIKKQITIPLVGDIHFDPHLAVLAMENGCDKIRINPGNIGGKAALPKIIDAAKRYHVAIRIGVNSGSLDAETLAKNDDKVTAQGMVDLAKTYVTYFEEAGFYDLVLSLKASSALTSIAAYRLASETFPYPLHLGITEAGTKDVGVIRSAVGLTPLLLEGIGDTIRISLTDDPKEEIMACKQLLHELGLYPAMPTLISCPTCGRTSVDLIPLVQTVHHYLQTIKKPITVAVMGCVVNGPGEAKHADLGLAGGKEKFVLFRKGQVIETLHEKEALSRLLQEIEQF